MSDKVTFDLEEAAAFLKMSPEALRRKAKAREIPGAKVGKCWCFYKPDLVAYLRSRYWIDKAPVIRFLPEPKRRVRWLTKEEAGTALRTFVGRALSEICRQAQPAHARWHKIGTPTRSVSPKRYEKGVLTAYFIDEKTGRGERI